MDKELKSQVDISIVIPVFNEEENVTELHSRLTEVLSKLGKTYEIIWVDDGSIDGTLDVLRQLVNKSNNVRIIAFRRNFGQTAALSAGFNFANGDVIIPMDGDLQNEPEDIPRLLNKIDEGFDVVSGWRKKRKDRMITRRIPSFLANWIISRITGVHLHDYGCTLKVYRKEVVKNIHLYGEMHRFIPALASWMGVSVTEIEVKHNPRRRGKTKYSLSRTPRVILDLINVKFLLSYSTRPIQIFGGIGIFLFFLSFISLAAVVAMRVFRGTDMTGNPLLYLSILFVIVGGQFITLGLLGEINIRAYHESQKRPIYAIKEIVNDDSELS